MVAMVALQQEAQQRGRQDATVAAQRDTTLRIEHVEAEFARERQQLQAEAERLRSELRQQASAAQQHAANASQAFAEADAARNALVTQAASYQQEASARQLGLAKRPRPSSLVSGRSWPMRPSGFVHSSVSKPLLRSSMQLMHPTRSQRQRRLAVLWSSRRPK